MSVLTKSERPTIATTDTAAFTLPKRDITDLLRSSALPEPFDDLELLYDCMTDVEILRLVLEEFRTNGPRRIEKIASCVEAGDAAALTVAARQLKASADAISAHRLRDLAGAVEQSSGSVGRGCQTNLVQQLRAEMNRCLEHIPMVIAAAFANAN
jgi:HPt (histidine-containing phosphotransfer) domain-containing protein